jgi:hypothetical protein
MDWLIIFTNSVIVTNILNFLPSISQMSLKRSLGNIKLNMNVWNIYERFLKDAVNMLKKIGIKNSEFLIQLILDDKEPFPYISGSFVLSVLTQEMFFGDLDIFVSSNNKILSKELYDSTRESLYLQPIFKRLFNIGFKLKEIEDEKIMTSCFKETGYKNLLKIFHANEICIEDKLVIQQIIAKFDNDDFVNSFDFDFLRNCLSFKKISVKIPTSILKRGCNYSLDKGNGCLKNNYLYDSMKFSAKRFITRFNKYTDRGFKINIIDIITEKHDISEWVIIKDTIISTLNQQKCNEPENKKLKK